MGDTHPESPARLDAITNRLTARGMDNEMEFIEAPEATPDQLQLVHDEGYVASIYQKSPAEGLISLDPDTCMNPHSLSAALRAAGAAILGVDRVVSGQNHAAFCCTRPPGHHATRSRAMGFCIFNNIAIGAAHAISRHALKKVAIVDFDVHHGNGTEDIFLDRPEVMLCSTFESPFYPYTGTGVKSDHIINIPLSAGTAAAAFREAVSQRILPALDKFKPELMLFSAGFDAHVEDPLADFLLRESDYAWVTSEVRKVADRHARGRMVSVLEGGYALSALGRSTAAHIEAML